MLGLPMASCALPVLALSVVLGAGGCRRQESPVARWNGGQLSAAELDQLAALDLYEVRAQALARATDEALLEQAARQAGQSVPAFLEQQVRAKVPEVDEAHMREFFGRNQAALGPAFGGKSFEEAAPAIRALLIEPKRRTARRELLQELRERAGLQVQLTPPAVAAAPQGPSRGGPGAPWTLVEVSDLVCPDCGRLQQLADRLYAASGGRLRHVFAYVPLAPTGDPSSERLAAAVACAEAQGAFWRLRDRLAGRADLRRATDLGAEAQAAGLDRARFDDCLRAPPRAEPAEVLRRQIGLGSHPALLLDGKAWPASTDYEPLAAIIRSAPRR